MTGWTTPRPTPTEGWLETGLAQRGDQPINTTATETTANNAYHEQAPTEGWATKGPQQGPAMAWGKAPETKKTGPSTTTREVKLGKWTKRSLRREKAFEAMDKRAFGREFRGEIFQFDPPMTTPLPFDQNLPQVGGWNETLLPQANFWPAHDAYGNFSAIVDTNPTVPKDLGAPTDNFGEILPHMEIYPNEFASHVSENTHDIGIFREGYPSPHEIPREEEFSATPFAGDNFPNPMVRSTPPGDRGAHKRKLEEVNQDPLSNYIICVWRLAAPLTPLTVPVPRYFSNVPWENFQFCPIHPVWTQICAETTPRWHIFPHWRKKWSKRHPVKNSPRGNFSR